MKRLEEFVLRSVLTNCYIAMKSIVCLKITMKSFECGGMRVQKFSCLAERVTRVEKHRKMVVICKVKYSSLLK